MWKGGEFLAVRQKDWKNNWLCGGSFYDSS